MGPNINQNQTIKLCNRLITLHTQTCSIQCSVIIASADQYMSLGLGIYIGLRASMRLCFSFKAVNSLANCSIKTPHHTSWYNILLESLFLGLQNKLLFDTLVGACALWSYFEVGKKQSFLTLTLTLTLDLSI